MNEFLIALHFITRIPVKRELNYTDKAMAKSMIYFPFIGTILVIVNYLADIYLGSMVTSSLLVAGLVILTGGIHLDGFMDSCDGIFSGGDRERILEIMKDSRVGAFGVIGLVTLFLVKFSLFMEAPLNYKSIILQGGVKYE